MNELISHSCIEFCELSSDFLLRVMNFTWFKSQTLKLRIPLSSIQKMIIVYHTFRFVTFGRGTSAPHRHFGFR